MELEKITMPKEVAKEEWKKYNDLLKKRKDQFLKDMKKSMYELSKGNELIDIHKIMGKIGVNKDIQPKMAIARADWKSVHFTKRDSGRGFFSEQDSDDWGRSSNGDISLPPETFMQWPRLKKELKTTERTYQIDDWNIANQKMRSKVPIIPSNLMPEGDLKGYYILWEVDAWENLPPKKDDPILLKRITENLFVILGAWDVTELEQSIINGLK